MLKDEFVKFGHIFTREQLETWGTDYLLGTDDEIFSMSDFDWLNEGADPTTIASRVLNGEDFYPYGDDGKFNINRAYLTFDGYGDFMSIDMCYLAERVELCLDADFIDFCEERGYISEEVKDIEEEEE